MNCPERALRAALVAAKQGGCGWRAGCAGCDTHWGLFDMARQTSESIKNAAKAKLTKDKK